MSNKWRNNYEYFFGFFFCTEQGCQIGHFMAILCAGHKKTHLAILWNLAIFSEIWPFFGPKFGSRDLPLFKFAILIRQTKCNFLLFYVLSLIKFWTTKLLLSILVLKTIFICKVFSAKLYAHIIFGSREFRTIFRGTPWGYTNNPTLPKPFSKEKSICETPHRLGYSFQTNKIKWNWKVLLFGVQDTNTKPKNVPLRNPFETPSDSRVSWTKEQAKQEIYTKIGRLQFCSLGFLELIPVKWKSIGVSAGHVSITKWQKLVLFTKYFF